MTQNQRKSSDDDSNKKDHELTTGYGKSGGNAGAGKSGTEGLGTEKKSEDERFGSQKPGEKQWRPSDDQTAEGTLTP